MDFLTITFNADTYGSETAMAETWLDGKMLGRSEITASRRAGQGQAVTWAGDFGSAEHKIAVFFKNDAWGGTTDTDRNLYVIGVTFNGTYIPVPVSSLFTNADRFDVTIPASKGHGTPTLMIRDFTNFKSSTTGGKDSWSNSFPPGENRFLNIGTEDQWYSDPTKFPYNPFTVNEQKQLVITARRADSPRAGQSWNSGCLSSDGFFQQTYGYFNFRLKLCAGTGWWPAAWMLPSSNNFEYTCEADIMESWQGDQSYVQQTLIGPAAGGATWPSRNVRPRVAGGAENAFHDYAMDWRQDKVRFFLDGIQTGEFDTPTTMHGPMYLLVNLAVGKPGSWVTSPAPGAVGTLTIAEIAAYP